MNTSEDRKPARGGACPSQSEMLSTPVQVVDHNRQTETRILSAVRTLKQCECSAAWETLLLHYQPLCRRIARAALPQHYSSWAEDIAQQSLTIIYRKLDTWQGSDKSSLDAWVWRIVQRETLRMIRQNRRWEVSVDRPSLAVHDRGYEDEGLQWLEIWDEFVAFHQTLSSPAHRQALMHLVEGHRPTAIACSLDLPASTVRRMIDWLHERFSRFRERSVGCVNATSRDNSCHSISWPPSVRVGKNITWQKNFDRVECGHHFPGTHST